MRLKLLSNVHYLFGKSDINFFPATKYDSVIYTVKSNIFRPFVIYNPRSDNTWR